MNVAQRLQHLNPRAKRAATMQAAHEPAVDADRGLDLRRRREQLAARMAELQWDLGGLVYEMAGQM